MSRLIATSVGALIFSLAAISGGCDTTVRVKGSGVAKRETREVSAFKQIHVQGAARLSVDVGDKQAVTVETDDNVLPLIETRVEDESLVIRPLPDHTFDSKLPVTVTVTVPALEALRVSGAVDAQARGVTAQRFVLVISGSGNVRVAGKADAVDVTISGSGNVDAHELVADTARVAISGSGQIKVHAEQTLEAQISGSGDVRYAGKPKTVNKHISGSGSITPL